MRHTIVVNMRGVFDLHFPRLLVLVLIPACLLAHPMGNFSVNHYSRIHLEPQQVEIIYALDLAEIPTFELLQKWNLTAESPNKALRQKAAEQMETWAKSLDVQSNGKTLHPVYRSSELLIADGAGNMPVMRITAKLVATGVSGKVEYLDNNYKDRAGWKEVVVTAADSAKLTRSSVGKEDRSKALTEYPDNPASAPPQVLTASAEWTSAKPVEAKAEPAAVDQTPVPVPQTAPVAAQTAGTVVRGDFLSDLLSKKEISFGMILIGIAVAFGLGAVHAFSPGHGKTMVAAYLVGSRG